ncbi:MAG TPA: hypothetical protein ENJ45_06610 [Phaeodactylibacter sp.]|nr:hypothetical protein [Phaeodactylibacter sp.]
MISKKYRSIFIHIHKTAGSSIEKKLGLFDVLAPGVQDHRKIREIERLPYRSYHVEKALVRLARAKFSASLHHLYQLYKPELSRREYLDFYKFTFVRNSWGRMYSWYADVMSNKGHQKNYRLPANCSFKNFLERAYIHKGFSQLDFITDSNGDIPLDFIGRFENLHKDFAKVCAAIGLEDTALPRLLVSGKKHHYSHYYDEACKDLVYGFYRKEIKYFGFEFEEVK